MKQQIQPAGAAPSRDTLGLWLLRVVQGALIGVGSILPGISGGVLCVLFGIYEPMMNLLAHPIKTFKIHFKLFIPIIIGFVVGFIGLAKVVEWMFSEESNISVCLFIGLIIGMLPSLFRDAGSQGRSKGSWIAFAISLVVLFAFLVSLENMGSWSIEPNIFWYFFCGIVWGISLVVPGMSSSSILIFMGLYQPMTAGIGSLDFAVILPLALGILTTAILLARLINRLFERHYSIMSHIVLGVVIASTAVIIPFEFADTAELLFCLLSAVIGFFLAWGLDAIGKRYQKKAAAQQQ